MVFPASTHSTFIGVIILLINAFIYYEFTKKPLTTPHRGSTGPECVDPTFSRSGAAGRSLYFDQSVGLASLREATRDRKIHLAGDSTMRETFYELAALMKREALGATPTKEELAKRTKNKHSSQQARIGSTAVTYSWRPFCADIADEWNSMKKKTLANSSPTVVIFTCGLHDLLYGNETSITIGIEKLKKSFESTHNDGPNNVALLFKTSSPLLDTHLSSHRLAASHFRDANLQTLNSRIYSALSSIKGLAIADGHRLLQREDNEGECDEDGVHSKYSSVTTAISVAGYVYCVIGVAPYTITAGQLSLFLLFLCVLALYAYALLVGQMGDMCRSRGTNSNSNSRGTYASVRNSSVDDSSNNAEVEMHGAHSRKHMNVKNADKEFDISDIEEQPLVASSTSSSSQSISETKSHPSTSTSTFTELLTHKNAHSLFISLIKLGFILLIIYFMDSEHRLSWSFIGDKTYVRDTFIFVCLILLFVAIYTIQPAHTDDILNRDQTEEWKGWMQILFVLYHYFAAKEMYNMIRIFIGAYVWMTGYGNFLFFAKMKDYSFIRLVKVLFRLNFFVTFVCIAMDREFMQYYVCALHTTFFLMVYAVMYIKSEWNNSNLFIFVKFAACFILLFVVFDMPQLGLFEMIFGWNPLFLLNNSLHEWKFRSNLDHYATLLGMVCAWQLPRFTSLLASIEQSSPYKRYFGYSSIGIICLSCIIYWWNAILLLPKNAYNAQHAYTSAIPILAWIVLRNLTPTLRKYVLFMFTWCGRITLETYILQFHIWLSDDAATIIHYIPNYPLLNFVFATIIYITLSKISFDLTTVVSDALIPKNCTTEQFLKRTLWLAVIWCTLANACKIILLTPIH